MDNVWLVSAVWLGLALLASVVSIRIAISVALAAIMVGALAGNTIWLEFTEWANFLAGFGAILLTFLAGTEIVTNGIIDQRQYTILVTAVIGSAVIPTLIAQRWFQPAFKPIGEDFAPVNPSRKEA